MLSHSADFITTVMSNSSNIHCLEEVQNLPIAESRATEAVGVSECNESHSQTEAISTSQATMSDSLSQFIAAQSGNDKELIVSLRKRIRRLSRQLIVVRENAANLKKNLSRFLNADQIDSLSRKAKSRGMRWTNSTLKKSLQIRCATGVKGYSHLIREGFPLPSYRTLCERIEKAQFEPGIQHNVLEWLQVKVDSCGNQESRDCVIALDEMQLHPTIEFDRGNIHCKLSLEIVFSAYYH
jgi:hypothetical protein